MTLAIPPVLAERLAQVDWPTIAIAPAGLVLVMTPFLWWEYRSLGFAKGFVSATAASIGSVFLCTIGLALMSLPVAWAELNAPNYGAPDLWLIPGAILGVGVSYFIARITGFYRWSRRLPQDPEPESQSLWRIHDDRTLRYPEKPLSLD